MKCENNEAINSIREDIHEIKLDLATHMARTKASEDRLELIEDKLLARDDVHYQRYQDMDKANKAFTYKVLVGFVMAALLPFLLKLLGQ